MISLMKEKQEIDFGTGVTNTEEFKKYSRKFKRNFEKILEFHDLQEYNFNLNHFCFSGFFKIKNQWFYFSISDVRFFPDKDMLIRTCDNDRDFTGYSNNYIQTEKELFNFINRKVV